jgi:hypothetical protein
MVVVKTKKREAIPEADNRLAKARASGITARRKLMEADGGMVIDKTTADVLFLTGTAQWLRVQQPI